MATNQRFTDERPTIYPISGNFQSFMQVGVSIGLTYHFTKLKSETGLCETMFCNDGTCAVENVDGKKSAICKCSETYVGENCQIPAVCKGSPCQNGGICDFADNSIQACFSLKIFMFFCKRHFHSVRMKLEVKPHEPLKVFQM